MALLYPSVNSVFSIQFVTIVKLSPMITNGEYPAGKTVFKHNGFTFAWQQPQQKRTRRLLSRQMIFLSVSMEEI